jgi:Ca2+-binding RTX toxin-like protein
MRTGRITRRIGLVVVGLLAGTVAIVSGPTAPIPTASANYLPDSQWYEGVAQYSTILNCFSIIGGYTYSEKGAAAWVSFESNPESARPAVGDSFDIKVSVFGLGNACSGQRFIPAFTLPSGVALDPARDVTCWSSANGQPLRQLFGSGDCPSRSTNFAPATFEGGATMYLSSDTQNASTWPLPSGVLWEFHIPVKATTPQSASNLQGHVRMFDGNDNPVLQPRQGLFVFGAAQSPTIWYDQPSTLASTLLPGDVFPCCGGQPSAYGIYSVGYVNTRGTEGTFYMDLGTSPGSANLGSVAAGSTNPADVDDGYQIAADWAAGDGFGALVPGQTYHWHLRYDRTSGADIVGASQSFTVPVQTTCNGLAVTVNLGLGQQPTEGNDVILGTSASETIAARGGNDTICALGGKDTIVGGGGNDWINGGAGINSVSFANAPAGVTVNLAVAGAQSTGEGVDTLISIANVTGSPFRDVLTGNSAANVFGGLAGNDTFIGGPGNDTFDGGTGRDTVSYSTNSSGVRVTLTTTSAQDTLSAGLDRLRGIENLIGTPTRDQLTGNSAANKLTGGGGNDSLAGGASNDSLVGGPGQDTCAGGTGTDSQSTCEVLSGFP